MTKAEVQLLNVDGAIKYWEKEIRDSVRGLKAEADMENLAGINALGIQTYGLRIAEAQARLIELYKTKRVLEELTKED